MKSTMKSAFAIIAVALMIMVAVVPMVGVFTDESDATTITDPGTAASTKITIKGSVTAKSGQYVQLEYIANSVKYTANSTALNSDGSLSYTFTVYEEKITSIVLTLLNKDGTKDTMYEPVYADNYVASSSDYTLNIIQGYASKVVTMYFADGTTTLTSILGSKKISASYKVFVGETEITSCAGTFGATGTATVYYPTGSTGVKIAVSGFQVDGGSYSAISFASDAVSIDGEAKVKAKENVYTVTVTAGVTGYGLSVTKVVDGAATPVEFKQISKDIGTTGAYYTFIDTPIDGIKATVTATDGTYKELTTTLSNNTITATISGAVYGSVGMPENTATTITYTQAGSVKFAYTHESVTQALNLSYGADGKFFTFPGTSWTPAVADGDAAADKIVITVGDYTVTQVGSTAYTSAGIDYTATLLTGATVLLDNTDYVKISGKITVSGDSASTGIIKTMSVTGGKTYGSLASTTSGYAFLVEKGKNITIKPSDASTYKYLGQTTYLANAAIANADFVLELQTVSIKLADALGQNIPSLTTVKFYNENAAGETTDATGTYSSVTKTYTAKIRSDIATSDLKVYITGDNYVFTNNTSAKAVAYVEGQTYKATTAGYTVSVKDKDGTALSSQPTITVSKYSIYKNTAGAIIYDSVSTVSASTNTYYLDASLVNKSEADVGTTPIYAYCVTFTSDAGYYKSIYFAQADAKGVISIVASVDSFTGKLVRNDGVTPIAGIAVVLNNGTSDVTRSNTYTQADGSFTVYSDKQIASGYKVKFTDVAGYYTFTSEGYNVYTDGVKNTTFKAATSAYTVSVVDADGAKVILADSAKFKIGAVEFTAVNGTNTATATANWTATSGKDLAITEFDTADIVDGTARSFENITLSATDLTTGKITLATNQSTYTFNVTDSAGAGLNDATVQFYKYIGDYAENISTTKTTATVYGVKGVASILLPLASEKDLDTVYGYTVSLSNYAFPLTAAKITGVTTTVKSTSALKTVTFQDAAGVALTINPAVTVYGDDSTTQTATVGKGYFTYVATKDVEYTYSIAKTELKTASTVKYGEYTFDAYITDVKGVVTANEETIYGSITDAAGNYFGQAVKAYIHYVDKTGVQFTGVQNADDKKFMIVADKSEIDYYQAAYQSGVDATKKYFSFEKSETADINAVETFVPVAFATSNGNAIDSTGYGVTKLAVVDNLGYMAEKSVVTINGVEGVVVYVDDVAYYAVTFESATTDKMFGKGTYTSKDGAFVSDMATYTGSVGVSDTEDDVTVEIYNGSALVSRFVAEDAVDDGVYSIYANTSLGDKVIVTYTASDKSVYTAVMDNKTVYNDLKKVVVADDLKAKIIGGSEYGSTSSGDSYFTYTLSTDKSKVYLMAINSYTLPVSDVAGDANVESLVAKYVFAGWYVNGEKATKDLTYTVDNVDSNVVMALYEFDGYYEVDKPVSADNGISPTVLVIGIAAVIIALIAVVYAVIQKKE